MSQESLWRTLDRSRHFIIPGSVAPPPGALAIRCLSGDEISADDTWLLRFEVSEREARDWARSELGDALGELRGEIDARLSDARNALEAARHAPVSDDTDITPDAVPALLALVGKLPRAMLDSLSGKEDQVLKARESLAIIQQRLRAAGIDVGDKLEGFPDRLAGLREDFERRRKERPD